MKKIIVFLLIGMLCSFLAAQEYDNKEMQAAAAGYGTITVNCCLVDSASGAAINNARVYAFFKSSSNVRSAETEASYGSGNYTLTLSSYYSGKGYLSVRAVGYQAEVLKSLYWQSGKTYTYPIKMTKASPGGSVHLVGLRSSLYGAKDPGDGHFYDFPSDVEWINGAWNMVNDFYTLNPSMPPGEYRPLLIWTVGEHDTVDLGCYLDFNPGVSVNGTTIKINNWDEIDVSKYLAYFDGWGVEVYVQVEPGKADMTELIKLVLDKMKKGEEAHSCIVGLGVDVEFYKKDATNPIGVQVSDDDAKKWENQIKTYGADLKLFLKHWETGKMPPTYRGDIIFANDAQGFGDLAALNTVMKTWSSAFSKNDVLYQYGYLADKTWWVSQPPPIPATIGNYLGANAACDGQQAYMVWVDFSMRDIPTLGFYKNNSVQYSLKFDIRNSLVPSGTPIPGPGIVYNYNLGEDVAYSYSVPGKPADWVLCLDWPTKNDEIPVSGTLSKIDHDHKFIFKLKSYSPEDYPPWKLGATYKVGDMVSYKNKVYKCLQAHTAYAANWNPEQAPALWKLIN